MRSVQDNLTDLYIPLLYNNLIFSVRNTKFNVYGLQYNLSFHFNYTHMILFNIDLILLDRFATGI